MWRRSRPCTALEARPSDAPVALEPGGLAGAQLKDRSRRAAVKRPAGPDPGRLPSTCAPGAAHASPETRHLPRGFAAAGSGFRRLALPGAPGRITPAPGRSGAACRLLQSSRSSSTTADRPTTPRPARGSPPGAAMRAAVPLAEHDRPSRPRVRGRRGRFALASASPRDRSLGELCPDALSSGTSCREIAPGPAG